MRARHGVAARRVGRAVPEPEQVREPHVEAGEQLARLPG